MQNSPSKSMDCSFTAIWHRQRVDAFFACLLRGLLHQGGVKDDFVN